MKVTRSLFEPVVEEQRFCPEFREIRTLGADFPSRRMLEDVYQDFNDPNGNFVEQFQTTAFHARYFELYLFAYFSRSGYTVDRNKPRPDFLVSRNGVVAAIEATTVNPSTSGVLSDVGKNVSDLSEEEIRDYEKNELPIRFGSPLYSKLGKRYWELDHCRGLPFVIAIEAFHDKEAMIFSDSALAQYVYGRQWTGALSRSGVLEGQGRPIESHQVVGKSIPSGFFYQPDSQHVSAVLFTNSGTSAKFSRIGYQSGFGCNKIKMERAGYCFNQRLNAADPTFFRYDLDQPPFVESWGQGLMVLYNPNAVHPLPRDFFVCAAQMYIEGGTHRVVRPAWHPVASTTATFDLGDVKQRIPDLLTHCARISVSAIEKSEFQDICGTVYDSSPSLEERGWFSDETRSFLGVVVRDQSDDNWGYVVLGRDPHFQFLEIGSETRFATRHRARIELQHKIARLLSKAQRLFQLKEEEEEAEKD